MSGGVELTVRAKPRASRPGLGPVRSGSLEVRIGAAPVDGAANDELIALLAERLDLPRRNLTVVGGEHARTKRVRIDGLSASEARMRLGLPAPGSA